MSLRLGVPLVLCPLACVAPRIQLEGQYCRVEVHEQLGRAKAEDLVERIDRLSPAVAAILTRPVEARVPVQVLGRPYVYRAANVGAVEVEREPRIVLGSAAFASPEFLDAVLSHELTHYYLRDCLPPRAPYHLHEGLAWYVAARLVPPLPSWPLADLEVRKDPAFVLGLSKEGRDALTGLEVSDVDMSAAGIVQQIGLERVLEMLEDERISSLELAFLVESVEWAPRPDTVIFTVDHQNPEDVGKCVRVWAIAPSGASACGRAVVLVTGDNEIPVPRAPAPGYPSIRLEKVDCPSR